MVQSALTMVLDILAYALKGKHFFFNFGKLVLNFVFILDSPVRIVQMMLLIVKITHVHLEQVVLI